MYARASDGGVRAHLFDCWEVVPTDGQWFDAPQKVTGEMPGQPKTMDDVLKRVARHRTRAATEPKE